MKDKMIKRAIELELKAMRDYCEDTWYEMLRMLTDEERHEYYWINDDGCTYCKCNDGHLSCPKCTECKALAIKWRNE